MIKKIILGVLMVATCASLGGVCYGCYLYNNTNDVAHTYELSEKDKDKIMNTKDNTLREQLKNPISVYNK